MNLVATLFVSIAMIINKDFQAIPREARDYEFGEVKYYVVLVTTAIVWQFLFLGLIGIIYCSSSLFAGIVNALLLPLTEVAAVIAYNEKFTGEKGMALALCLWGFTSFFIGEYKKVRKPEPTIEPTEDLSSHSNLDV
ncbi:Purine permease [Thalictrum thalictroides]|uniref:Purine permease n=1 Tax=Thalictrum thalictroides TaxID=46969 RepID=A0A7J6WR96_THATH|nr:Purine permease [Thalictrum thalictroides]